MTRVGQEVEFGVESLQRVVAQKRRCFRNNLTGILKGDKDVSFVALAMIFEILNGCYQTVLNACL
jgi:hypothetical protein